MHVRRAALLALVCCAPVLAHSDDPKVLDREPRYEGPAWRLDVDGLRGSLGFEASGVEVLSWLPLSEFGSFSSGNDCWGYVSPSGREYAIMGLSAATSFVEITNPGNAQIVATLSGPDSLWRDIKVYQHYAYTVSEGGSGIQVFDMSQIDNGTVSLVNTITTGGTTATHNVALDTVSGFLYRCGGDNNGIRIYSLANPTTPALVASWSTRYVHDCQAVTYTEGPYAGKQIVFACSGFNGGFDQTGLDILDVTNKASIQLLGRIQYSTAGYSHQGWLSPDRQYFYLDDELDEQTFGYSTRTRVIDVSDLANPVEVGTYTNGSTAIDHNLYTAGNYTYAANYRSGLRVFDRSDPIAPIEVAYFDTYPGSNSANFNGLWSNYPFFPSGTVIGSDLERGLFVWRIDLAPLAIQFPAGRPSTLDPSGGTTIDVQFVEQFGGTLDVTSPTLYVNSGSGYVAYPMSPLGGGLYEGTFPPVPCGDTATYYVSGTSEEDETVVSPSGAPAASYDALAVDGITTLIDETFEAVTNGWSINPNGSDTAATGQWVRVDPVGTAAQPEDDHTVAGTRCWVTGQGVAGGGVGDNDVDSGRTTLRSATFDASGLVEPRLSYWRWYSNDQGAAPNADVFTIDISNNDGASWTNVETVGPSGAGTSGGWIYHEFRIADFVTPTSTIRLRFIAEDAGSGSIVEAAIDDLRMTDLVCAPGCDEDLDGDGSVGLGDLSMLLENFGTPSGATAEDGDLDGDGDVDLADLSALLEQFGLPC